MFTSPKQTRRWADDVVFAGMRRLLAVALAAFAFGCPRPPVAVLKSIEKPEDVRAIRDAFNADAEHRRLLVLLSPH